MVNHIYLNLSFFFANWFFRKIRILSLVYIFPYFFSYLLDFFFLIRAVFRKQQNNFYAFRYQFHIFFHHFCVFRSIRMIFIWNNVIWNTLIKTDRNIFLSAIFETFVWNIQCLQFNLYFVQSNDYNLWEIDL